MQVKQLLRRMARVSLALCAFHTQAATVDYLREIKPILAETCYRCHGIDQQKSGLRLDTAAFALKGGEHGPAMVPGQGAESLMIRALTGTHPEISRMPYKRPPLSETQIALLQNWIDQGAKAPAGEAAQSPAEASSRHWAFLPPKRAPEPIVRQAEWCRNAIDRFVLARLEKEGIKPGPEADRMTLIRRLSFDLLGLPPMIAQVEEFLGDERPDAYEHLVDRLLASAHYGERWARHWLDIARYADSNGYSIDAPRSIWKYRDWVIDVLNRDLPFDEFAICQLAGDLLPNATLEQKIATGFHRNTPINEEGGIDKEQFRIESVIDRVNTTATAFLGLTMGCAQCHDHKFDPITQKEYFQFFAFLNNADEPVLEVGTPEELAQLDALRAKIKKQEAELKQPVEAQSAAVADWERSLSAEARSKLRTEVRTALDTESDKRSDRQKQALFEAFTRGGDEAYRKIKSQLAQTQRREPKLVTTMVVKERAEPRHSYVFIKGDFTRKGETVAPGVPKVLPPLPPTEKPNRLDLARWLVSPENPLTARVTMNRLWLHYFGKGLVETENDFGTQGTPPSHPDLLDWLATEFMGQSWSLKAMHKLIVTSAAYRQSSRVRPELDLIDPRNKLLARQSRLRLDAEIVRDAALAASGLLSDKIGGPGVFPPIPDGVMSLGQVRRDWKPEAGPNRYRRGLYTFFWRATPHPGLMVFDAPDATSACTRRIRSNTPLQALTLLNDKAFFELAQGLAARVLRERFGSVAERIDFAFRLCLARPPSNAERERLMELLAAEEAGYAASPEEAKNLLPKSLPVDVDATIFAAWTAVSRVLLNLDECITRE